MGQPTVYNEGEENKLIEWLKENLEQQRKDIAKKKKIYESEVKDEELTLNIGNSSIEIKINFHFYFRNILTELLSLEKKEPKFDENNTICPYKLNVINITFSGDADFNFFTFSGEASFNGSAFSEEANFNKSTFSGEADFSGSTFSGEASFNKSIFSGKADFNKSTFSSEADFSYSIFSGLTYFNYSTFSGYANFRGSTFSKNANFIESIFSGLTDFSYSKFSGLADFSGSTFSSKANFHNIKFETNEEKKDEISISFDNIKLEDNSYISFNNINYDNNKKKFTESENSKIEIVNTVIKGRIDFNNVSVNTLNFDKTVVIGNGVIGTDNLKAKHYNSWKTARFLKHEAYKISNTIEALKFKGIEKDLYLKELVAKKDKAFQTWAEILSIRLSKLSNNHGQDWFKAVLFTLVAGLIFFTIFYAPNPFVKWLNPQAVQTTWKGFLYSLAEYFIPIKYDAIIEYLEFSKVNVIIKICGMLIYFTGKIAIGYGIVEIVQAFRKLNSKG